MGNRGTEWRGGAFGHEPVHGAIQDEEIGDRQTLADRELIAVMKKITMALTGRRLDLLQTADAFRLLSDRTWCNAGHPAEMSGKMALIRESV